MHKNENIQPGVLLISGIKPKPLSFPLEFIISYFNKNSVLLQLLKAET